MIYDLVGLKAENMIYDLVGLCGCNATNYNSFIYTRAVE